MARRNSTERGRMSNVGGGASASVDSVLIEQNLKEGRGVSARRFRTGFRKGLGLVFFGERAPLPHSARRAPPHSGARRSPSALPAPSGLSDKPRPNWFGCSIPVRAQYGIERARHARRRFQQRRPCARAALPVAVVECRRGIPSPLPGPLA